MARYCDYCHSYLTHDTPSVRKSHVLGKNHLRLRVDYYCNKAHQTHKPIFGKKRTTLRARKHAHKNSNQGHAAKDTTDRHVTLHCDTNRQKRQSHRNTKDEDEPIGVLQRLYRHAPAYAKVFKSDCRLDTGQSVRLDRLPQRANRRGNEQNRGTMRSRDPDSAGSTKGSASTSAAGSVSRHTLYTPDYSTAGSTVPSPPLLPPPRSLMIWPTAPALTYANGGAAEATVRELTRRIQRT